VLVALATRRVPLRAAAVLLVALPFGELLLLSRDLHGTAEDSVLTYRTRFADKLRSVDPLGRVFTNYDTTQYELYGERDADVVRLGIDAMSGDSTLPLGIPRTYGGDALQVADTRAVADLLSDASLPQERADRLADLLGVRFAVVGPPFEDVAAAEDRALLRAVERRSALPRARLVDDWRVAPSPREALPLLLDPRFDPGSQTVVDTSTPAWRTQPLPEQGTPVRTPPGQVLAVRPGNGRVEVDVQVARRALLVLSETWFPGWIARVDGVVVPLHRADSVFRAVRVEPGRHTVAFAYEPRSFRNGALLSAGTLVLMALILLGARTHGRFARASEPPVSAG